MYFKSLYLSLSFFFVVLFSTYGHAFSPYILSNGIEQSNITIGEGEFIHLDVGLSTEENHLADWWFVMQTGPDVYYYDTTIDGLDPWQPGIFASHQGETFDFGPFEVYSKDPLESGTHYFYFGIDTQMDGEVNEPLYYSRLSVKVDGSANYSNTHNNDRMLVVLSAPSVNDQYYTEVFSQIIDFHVQYAKTLLGHDNVVVLADRDTMPFLTGRLPQDILLEASVADIWIRDFSTVLPSKMTQFSYTPSYFEKLSDAIDIQYSFNRFAQNHLIEYGKTNFIMDGGNFVDNNKDMAVVTERVLEDNNMTAKEAADKIKSILGLTHVAIIPYDDEIMGHADGMVMWVSDRTLFVNKYDEPFRTRVLNALTSGLSTDVKIVEMESTFELKVWKNFASACGVNINSLVTNKYIYMPVFGSSYDTKALELVKAHTDKQVKTVDAQNVCFMGGSVRCLSWQVTGKNAAKLISAARGK